MASNTGGPAFPHDWLPHPQGQCEPERPHAGMTLLDYFAGQVVVGLLTNPPLLNGKAGHRTQSDHAWMAYEIAAAMLAEKHRREATT